MISNDADALSRALTAGGIGLWQWEVAANRIHIDAVAASLLGREAGALPREEFLALIDAEESGDLEEGVRAALAGTGEIDHDFVIHGGPRRMRRWLHIKGRIDDVEGKRIGSGILCDVTQGRLEKEGAELLQRELAHRIKNLFSVVSSVASVSATKRPEAQEFVSVFQSRLNSLAAAHELLKDTHWREVPLDDLAEKVLAPLGTLSRIDISADNLTVGTYDTQTLVLVLHELATNAVKYGSLSNDSGSVRLSFRMVEPESVEDEHKIEMNWQEVGGPPVAEPLAKGFGMTLLDRLAKRQGYASPIVEWDKDGLSCRIQFRITTP